MKNIKKRHILILGGSSDIGIEVIKFFLKLNWKVTAHYNKNKKKLDKLKQKSRKLNLIHFDFSNYENPLIEKMIMKKFNGEYDSVVNLICCLDNKSFNKTTLKDILKSLCANSLVPILIERIALKSMLKKKWGRILNCSSIGIKFGGGKYTYNYSLAKHSLEFIPSSYKDWAQNNVLINNLRIGLTNTKVHKRYKKNITISKRIKLIPMNRMAEPYEISKYINDLVSDKNSFMTGQTITVSGGE